MKPETEMATAVCPKYLNIACGGTYVAEPDWENVDYTPHDERYVTRMNVLHKLQPSQVQYEAVYCSHFVEHVPPSSVPDFLQRCHALTAPGGVFRIVVPDAEFLLREYLKHKDDGNEAAAEFAYVNFLDQCVRQKQGGRLGEMYREIADGRHSDLVEYAIYLNGTVGSDSSITGGREAGATRANQQLSAVLKRILARLERNYILLASKLLPRGFRDQNVSFADVGELHHWMYDFDQLSRLLKTAGFSNVTRHSYDSSQRSDGIFMPLDTVDGQPRKGNHQLFLEAYP